MIGAGANGIPWLGHKVNQPGHAALILGEGGFDLSERLSSWLHGNPGATDDRMLFSVEEGLDLMDQQEVDQIIDELVDFADDWNLIIFDTQADHMPNGDEDKAKDFTAIKKRCSGSPMQPAQQSVSCTTPAGTTQGSAVALGSGRLWMW